MISCGTGVEFGELYCKTLELEKISALKSSRGNYDGLVIISPEGRQDITWWINHALISIWTDRIPFKLHSKVFI